MKMRSAIEADLFVPHQRAEQNQHPGDPLAQVGARVDFKALPVIARVTPRTSSPKSAPPPVSDRDPGSSSGLEAT